MSTYSIPFKPHYFRVPRDEITYNTWLILNNALAGISGGTGDLTAFSGYIMGQINSASGAAVITSSGVSKYLDQLVSGTLTSLISSTSGYLYSLISSGVTQAYVDNISGVLNTTIANASGAAVITASGAARSGHEAAYNHANYDTAYGWGDWHTPLNNASGTLNSKIDNISGTLTTLINTTSGYIVSLIGGSNYSYTIPSGNLLNNAYYLTSITGTVVTSSLNVNGMIYNSGYYSLQGDPLQIKWNNIIQNYMGFNLSNRDRIVFNYTK